MPRITGSAITMTYLTGLQLDEVLARYAGTGNKTLLTDALGSVIAQANDQQGIQNFYAYTPYGEAQALGPDDNNPVQYTARENDQTGLYYYRARYYDPVLKRFISEDPIGLQGGLNVYRYVSNDPLGSKDSLGLAPSDNPSLSKSTSQSQFCSVTPIGGLKACVNHCLLTPTAYVESVKMAGKEAVISGTEKLITYGLEYAAGETLGATALGYTISAGAVELIGAALLGYGLGEIVKAPLEYCERQCGF